MKLLWLGFVCLFYVNTAGSLNTSSSPTGATSPDGLSVTVHLHTGMCLGLPGQWFPMSDTGGVGISHPSVLIMWVRISASDFEWLLPTSGDLGAPPSIWCYLPTLPALHWVSPHWPGGNFNLLSSVEAAYPLLLARSFLPLPFRPVLLCHILRPSPSTYSLLRCLIFKAFLSVLCLSVFLAITLFPGTSYLTAGNLLSRWVSFYFYVS